MRPLTERSRRGKLPCTRRSSKTASWIASHERRLFAFALQPRRPGRDRHRRHWRSGSRHGYALAMAGAKVGVLGRRRAVAEEVAAQIQARGGDAMALPP